MRAFDLVQERHAHVCANYDRVDVLCLLIEQIFCLTEFWIEGSFAASAARQVD